MGQIKWRHHKNRRKTMFFCCLETPAIPRTPTVVVHPAPTPRCCSSNPSLTLCSPLESLGLNVGRQVGLGRRSRGFGFDHLLPRLPQQLRLSSIPRNYIKTHQVGLGHELGMRPRFPTPPQPQTS